MKINTLKDCFIKGKNLRLIYFGFIVISIIQLKCSNSEKFQLPEPGMETLIIADHTVVDQFDKIPRQYIDEVKKMLIGIYGESHAFAYGRGLELLEALDSRYSCNISSGEAYTSKYLRVEEPGYAREDLIFTWYSYPVGSRPNDWKVTWYKNLIKEYNNNGHPLSATGFGWCSDITFGSGTSTIDPRHEVRWYGSSQGGIDGDLAWGLDSESYPITRNRVNLTTYFGAFEELIEYCAKYSPSTKMIFTTGPVDPDGWWDGENGYQGHLKHEAIRDYIKVKSSGILFDYADILCYDDQGKLSTQTWNGHIFPSISKSNFMPQTTGHISNAGAIRLAKAQWWMLARIAGWDGE